MLGPMSCCVGCDGTGPYCALCGCSAWCVVVSWNGGKLVGSMLGRGVVEGAKVFGVVGTQKSKRSLHFSSLSDRKTKNIKELSRENHNI